MKKFIILLANSQHYFIHVLRIALFITMVWNGLFMLRSCGDDAVACVFGVALLVIGTMTLSGIWLYKIGLIGGLLTFAVSLVGLTCLIHAAPEAGRLIVKDAVLMVAGVISAADCAKQIFRAYVVGNGKV